VTTTTTSEPESGKQYWRKKEEEVMSSAIKTLFDVRWMDGYEWPATLIYLIFLKVTHNNKRKHCAGVLLIESGTPTSAETREAESNEFPSGGDDDDHHWSN